MQSMPEQLRLFYSHAGPNVSTDSSKIKGHDAECGQRFFPGQEAQRQHILIRRELVTTNLKHSLVYP